MPHASLLARPVRRCLLGLAILGLAGCAGARVGDRHSFDAPVRIASPRSIALVIEDRSPPPERARRIAGHARDVQTAEAALKRDIGDLLAKRGIRVSGQDEAPDLLLLCTITQIRSGSAAARLLIGYGAGKAILRTSTVLSGPAGAPVLLAFTISGTTGAMPGAGLGVASAAGSAGTLAHMAGPLLGVPGTIRQGLDQEASQTAARIDEQLSGYFAGRHWSYANGPRPDASGS